jgi:hypothetical protein
MVVCTVIGHTPLAHRPTRRPGSLDQDELHAAVLRAARLGAVVGDRLVAPVAGRLQA